MSLLIAAPCSGSGKTLVSLLLAAVAAERGLGLQTFKVGPDYLDPQLLSQASGRPCRNLDLLLCDQAWVQRSFRWWSQQHPLALVEGVMGLFDGLGPSPEGSSAAVAKSLNLPVLLVVEASRQAGSLAALVRGFRDHDPELQIAGVVLNGVSTPRHQQLLSESLAAIGMPLLGVLPRHPALELPSRHLGLLPPQDLPDWPQRLQQLAQLAPQWLQLDQLLPLLQVAPQPTLDSPLLQLGPAAEPHGAVVAIARDQAFHFCYPELAESLQHLGCTVQWWAPLQDQPLPPDTAAVVLPGGYPELHAAELSACRRSLEALRAHGQAGRPIYAECGGLLLLGEQLEDRDGQRHAMAGLLPLSARRGALSLGYRRATALTDGLLLRRGEQLRGHEFHRWQLEPYDPTRKQQALWHLEGWGVMTTVEGWSDSAIHASWLHLQWGGCPSIARRFGRAAQAAMAS
ncbi:MAG: cobyrinate a,c-diamide synthase [Synechococcus sp.]|nr:cobyrinate a,c-diamide synthase [Synechococcus sp.]